MTNRLEQFWEFGHNCAVMGLTDQESEDILLFFQFNTWGMEPEEKQQFEEGRACRPLQWDRGNLRRIYIRPTEAKRSKTERKGFLSNKKPRKGVLSEERIEKIRKSSVAYWNSREGQQKRQQINENNAYLRSIR